MIKSFLQTQDWLDFQKHIGRKAWRFDDGKVKANIIQHDLPFGKNYLYIPHGPEISFDEISGGIKNELTQFVSYLTNLGREEKSIFIKIEPLDDKVIEVMHGFGFKRSAKEIQPHRSVVIDLDKSEEELLSAMHHKTRYNIKVAEKYGIVVKNSDNLNEFWKLLKKTTKRDRFESHSREYYKKLLNHFSGMGNMKADLVMAYHNDKAIAGALVMICGDTCYYLHGASDYDARNMMAPYLLHWENIKYLKSHGVKRYDLWGIDAQRWPGVTRFKLGWIGEGSRAKPGISVGGREVEYPGSFDLSVSKIWYLIYRIARRMF